MNLDFKWIESHAADDTFQLRLKYGKEHADDILQIEMRRKHAHKFADTLSKFPQFVFPSSLSAEQSTSDRLAEFHATLIEPGSSVADLTAGMGIDTLALARKASEIVSVEINPETAIALERNTAQLHNVTAITGDCIEQVEQWIDRGRRFDCVFIDPARRAADGSRIYSLAQCEPNVLDIIPQLKRITSKLIIKASPMLDINACIKALDPYVDQIVALGTTTECKELVIVCNLSHIQPVEALIRAVTIAPGHTAEFSFTLSQEAAATAKFGEPHIDDYVFDPFPAVMKASPNKLLCEAFNIKKIAANTHLWFSHNPVEEFPGHTFRVLEITPYMSKNIKRYSARFPKVGVSALNFDITSDALRAKLKVNEGPLRLFAVKTHTGQKLLITCQRI